VKIDLAVLTSPGAHFSALGMTFDEGMSYETWAEIGATLQFMGKAIQFAIGDWLNFGEQTYGDKYWQAVDDTGYAYGTLRNFASVASRVELSRRNDKLSFAHHEAIAKLPASYHDKFLTAAEQGGFTSRQLKQAVDAALGEGDDTPHVPAHTCPNCGYQFD